jgi:hypothetical protein
MSTRTENRYAMRQEDDGRCTVCEIYSGHPAVIDGVALEHLDCEEAQKQLDRLNNLLFDPRETDLE